MVLAALAASPTEKYFFTVAKITPLTFVQHKGLYSILASGPAKRNGKLYAAQEDTLGFFLYQRPESHADTATLCRFMVDGRFRRGGAGGKSPGAYPAGLKIQGVKQVEALLEQEGGRSRALLLVCGFRLMEETTHTTRYVCRFETQNWRE